MQHTAEFMDISKFIDELVAPELIFSRKDGTWLVRRSQFNFEQPNNEAQDWAIQRVGDLVRVPLFPYRTASQDLAQVIMGAMDLQRRLDEHTLSVERSHTIVGIPVEDLQPVIAAYRFWIGFAVKLQ